MLVGGMVGLAFGLGLGACFRVAALVMVHLGAGALAPLLMVAGSASLPTCLGIAAATSLSCQFGFLLAASAAVGLRQPARDLRIP